MTTRKPTQYAHLTPARIQAARERLNLTQPKFAELIGKRAGRGISPSIFTISFWETGRKAPGELYGKVLERLIMDVEAGWKPRG